MDEASPYLQPDGFGVFRQKSAVVVKQFFSQPRDAWVHGESTHSTKVVGFQGGGTAFNLCVRAFESIRCDTDVVLRLKTETDIKVRVEWSVSIRTPTGEVLKTSKVSCADFERNKGTVTPLGNEKSKEYIFQYLTDKSFVDHQEIKEKGWLFDGSLHLGANVRFRILEGGFDHAVTSTATGDPILTALKNQLDSPILPDITLISQDGDHIKTHKLILGLRSPVFRAMFENDLEEARTGVCRIPDASTQSIKAMLGFLVGVEPSWSFDLAGGLLQLADKYELPDLLNKSALEFRSRLSTETVVEVLLLAHRHSVQTLLNEAFVFLEDNISQAAIDGFLVRLLSEKGCAELVRDWQAHWFHRKEGAEMKKDEEPAVDVEPEQNGSTM